MAISIEEENYTCPDKIAYLSRAIRARVLICWEQITLRFNSSGGTHISEGVAGDICSGEQKIRGEHISPLQRNWSIIYGCIEHCRHAQLNCGQH